MKKALLLCMILLSCFGVLFAQGSEESTEVVVDEGLKIALISSPSGVDDGSFNQNVYEGAVKFCAENPTASVTPVREEVEANAVPAVEEVVADYDVLICSGFQFAGISLIAEENPDKQFILVDSFPSDPDDFSSTIAVDNIYAMQFGEQESGFLAGLAAAQETKTGKVAVVNGVAYPSNVNYQFGFESGVNYSNAKYGTNVVAVELPSYSGTDVTGTVVDGNYIGDFADQARGKVVGESLIAEGCDIIFVAAGGAGLGVFTAAKETDNVMVIGCDADQFSFGEAGNRNIVLTTVLKVMDINVYRQLNAVKDGTFVGGNFTLYANTDSTGYLKKEGRHQLSDATMAKLDESFELIKDGTIVPAANFNGHASDNFPGLN